MSIFYWFAMSKAYKTHSMIQLVVFDSFYNQVYLVLLYSHVVATAIKYQI